MNIAISTHNLTRKFNDSGDSKTGEFTALSNVNLNVERGQIFGLLGPNGAGKTTLIKILSTLLLPSSGEAHVAGFNVDDEFQKIRPIINMVSGGENCGYGILTVEENLWMFSQFYGIPSKIAMPRIKNLLEIMGLGEKAGVKVSKLSTGMRQKMNFIRGFVTDPQILFLDEPTLGLDVNAARQTRKFVSDWVKNSETPRTVILTTHYMQEADEMCKRIAIIDTGKILAEDTPENLKNTHSNGVLYKFTTPSPKINFDIFKNIKGVNSFASSCLKNEHTEMIFSLQSDRVLPHIIEKMNETGVSLSNIQKKEFSLEDAFIKLVGKRLDGGEEEK